MTDPSEVEQLLGPLVEREGGGPEGWPAKIARFLDLLRDRNRSVNLVSRKTEQEALVRHVLPSLAVLTVVPRGEGLAVLDVGSGGGFPGIPLQILRPDARVDLLDATRKKCDFLRECVRDLGLVDTRVHWGRVESPDEELLARSPFQRIVARAVGADGLLERSVPRLLDDRGQAWVFRPPEEQGATPWPTAGGPPVTSLLRVC